MNFLKSAFIVSFFTLVSRSFGYIRDIFFAKYLGTGVLADVFFTAFRLPNFFRNIFAEGAFNAAFVPIFASTLVKDDKKAIKEFSNNLFSILLYSLLIFTLLIELFMPFVIRIIAPGFINQPSQFDLAIQLSRITFPYLIFISIVSFCSGILNSLNKFACVSIAPIILNISFITFSILSSFINIKITYLLSFAILVGGLFQLIWLLYFTFKNKMILYPKIPVLDDKTRIFFKNFSNSFISSGLVQINSMVDSIMATLVPSAVSYIYYGDRISQLPLALIGTAISISILPNLSKVIEQKLEKETSEMQENAIFIALFIGIPCAFALFIYAQTIVPILFERGVFTSKDSIAVINVLKLYSISLPLTILIKILQTIFYANKDTKTPMRISLISLISNVILNYTLIQFFSFYGIILSTIITYFLVIAALFKNLYKKHNLRFSSIFINNILKTFYISIITIIFALTLNKIINISNGTLLIKLFKLALSGSIIIIIYLSLAYFIDIINKGFIKNIINK